MYAHKIEKDMYTCPIFHRLIPILSVLRTSTSYRDNALILPHIVRIHIYVLFTRPYGMFIRYFIFYTIPTFL